MFVAMGRFGPAVQERGSSRAVSLPAAAPAGGRWEFGIARVQMPKEEFETGSIAHTYTRRDV